MGMDCAGEAEQVRMEMGCARLAAIFCCCNNVRAMGMGMGCAG
jgi:hypothetical protein